MRMRCMVTKYLEVSNMRPADCPTPEMICFHVGQNNYDQENVQNIHFELKMVFNNFLWYKFVAFI